MNKSYRIKTEVGTNVNKHIKLKLDQEYDSFEILSLSIDQKDVYQSFNCDYGVVIGRVNANGGVGIPNAKLSIFIPITDEDSLRPEIKAIYPYESPREKNQQGKRYNLLPRVGQTQLDGTVRPKQPFGTFPTKQEFVTNDSWLEVYETYYKYSTVTNDSGDFMLFGVPVGTQTVHMSVDVTDIGRFSMTPATMVTNLGYSENLFTDGGTKIKESRDLDDLPNIETQEISVDVIPFCGDDENFDIGITRQDFRIRAELISTFTLFGSAFTNGDGESSFDIDDNNQKEPRKMYREHNLVRHMATNRAAPVIEQFFYYPANISDADIINDPNNDELEERMIKLSDSEYSKFTRAGDFVYILPCNRNRVITNEIGELVPTSPDNPNGVFTEFKGFLTLEVDEEILPLNDRYEINDGIGVAPVRYKYKFPQSITTLGETLEKTDTGTNINAWRKQHYTFEFSKIYSLAKFHGLVQQTSESNNNDAYRGIKGFLNSNAGTKDTFDIVNRLDVNKFYNVGVIQATDEGEIENSSKEFPTNRPSDGQFGAQWMNFSIYFLQNGRFYAKRSSFGNLLSNTNFVPSVGTRTDNDNDNPFFHWVDANTQPIAGGIVNTQFYPRPDLHYTDIIEVPKADIVNINNYDSKGFTKLELDLASINLEGSDYRNGDISINSRNIVNNETLVFTSGSPTAPQGSGKVNGEGGTAIDTDFYFYKGLDESNCIQFLDELGLL
jgi:hypothetical protein